MAYSEDDLDAILDATGVDAVIGTETIRVVWRNRFRPVTMVHVAIESYEPFVLAKASDVENLSISHGTELELDDGTWAVIEMQKEITGFTRLVLEKQ